MTQNNPFVPVTAGDLFENGKLDTERHIVRTVNGDIPILSLKTIARKNILAFTYVRYNEHGDKEVASSYVGSDVWVNWKDYDDYRKKNKKNGFWVAKDGRLNPCVGRL